MASRRFGLWLFAALTTLSVACDRGTKWWAERSLAAGPVDVIRGVWELRLAHNTGLAFSVLAGWPLARVAALAVGVVLMIALAVAVWRGATRVQQCVGLALVAGGAVGNLYDRVAYGEVTDFIHWHWGAHSWPLFNVADALLLVGAAILLFAGARGRASDPMTG